MSQDIVADGLNRIMNAKRAGKTSVTLKHQSKFLINVLAIGKLKGYIANYHTTPQGLIIEFGKFHACMAVKPRYVVKVGDIDKYILDELYKEIPIIDVLKVPHHGSKNSLSKSFYYKIRPKISIIHVGENNSYGHPSGEILKILQEIKSNIRRTDKEGNIKIKL